MVAHTDEQTHAFPDGSTVEWRISTADSGVHDLLTTILTNRLHTANTLFPLRDRDVSLAAYAAFAPVESAPDNESTATHDIRDGELTVHIDATNDRVHGYLNYLVRDTVAYSDVLDIDVPRASLFAATFAVASLALAAVGQFLLAAIAFAPAGIVSLYVLLYFLSTRGVWVSFLGPRTMPSELEH